MSEVIDLPIGTDTRLPPKKPPAAKTAAAASAWQPMETAPKDGTWIYLLGDRAQLEWSWYQTRQFRKGSWQPIAWWRSRLGVNSPPNFQPSGWRKVSEGLPK